jgi:hypothetical protein
MTSSEQRKRSALRSVRLLPAEAAALDRLAGKWNCSTAEVIRVALLALIPIDCSPGKLPRPTVPRDDPRASGGQMEKPR